MCNKNTYYCATFSWKDIVKERHAYHKLFFVHNVVIPINIRISKETITYSFCVNTN